MTCTGDWIPGISNHSSLDAPHSSTLPPLISMMWKRLRPSGASCVTRTSNGAMTNNGRWPGSRRAVVLAASTAAAKDGSWEGEGEVSVVGSLTADLRPPSPLHQLLQGPSFPTWAPEMASLLSSECPSSSEQPTSVCSETVSMWCGVATGGGGGGGGRVEEDSPAVFA